MRDLSRGHVNLWPRVCSVLFFVLLFSSCYTYSIVRVDRRFSPGLNPVAAQKKTPDAPAKEKTPSHQIPVKKYLAEIFPPSPVAWMNNRGVEQVQQGKLREAGVLFREVLAEDPNAWAAWNNLGVVYELSGMHDDAFFMYSTACLHDPDNEKFRMNFLTFVDVKNDRAK